MDENQVLDEAWEIIRENVGFIDRTFAASPPAGKRVALSAIGALVSLKLKHVCEWDQKQVELRAEHGRLHAAS